MDLNIKRGGNVGVLKIKMKITSKKYKNKPFFQISFFQ